MHLWLDWKKLGDEGANTIAAAQYRDRRYLFASDIGFTGGTTNTGKLHVRSITAANPFAAEVDTGWEVFPVGGATNEPVGPAVFNEKLYVFATGIEDRRIYVSTTDDGTTWRDWEIVPFDFDAYDVTTAVFDGRLYLFTTGDEIRKIWVSSTADGSNWSTWAAPFPPMVSLGELPEISEGGDLVFGGAAAAAAVHDGKLHIISHDNDFNLFVSSSANGSQWSNWVSVGGVGGGVAGISFDGGLLVFSQGWDDVQIYMKGSSDGAKWSEPWEKIGSPPPQKYAGRPFVIGGGASIILYVIGFEGVWSRTAIYEVDTPPDY